MNRTCTVARRVTTLVLAGVLVASLGTVGPAAPAAARSSMVAATPAPGPSEQLPAPFDVVPLPGEEGAKAGEEVPLPGEEVPLPGEEGVKVGGRSTASATLDTEVDICPGAPLPQGYGVAGSMPYSTHAPTGTRYNPQGIVLFMLGTRTNAQASQEDRLCLLDWAAKALNAGSRTRTFVDGDGQRRVARLYPYPYSFSANPSLPKLAPNWISGLAQGSVLTVMTSLFDDTRDNRYLRIAQETFNSYLLPYRSGGFVTENDGLTYLQEYVTREPSYVLNGHNESAIALIKWARRTKDPKALDLARRTLAALHTTMRLEEINFPTGLATSYDLLRGWSASPVRAAPLNRLTVHSARLIGASRTGQESDFGAAVVTVKKATGRDRQLLKNPGFSSWSERGPTGWTVTGESGSNTALPGETPRSVRIISDGTEHVVVQQTLPKVKRSIQLTLSWTARLAVQSGLDSTPGDVVLQAVCGRKATSVAVADVRSPLPVEESISGWIPAGCAPRVKLYQADGKAPSDVTYTGVSLRASDPVGAARVPAYPLSALKVPTVSIKVTYSGGGWLQGWWQGQWTTFGFLSSGTRRTATIAVPAYLQGRTVNLRYHNAHVAELTQLYELTGDPLLRGRALKWLPYAPAMERYRTRLGVTVAPNPLYADLFTSRS